MADCNLESYTEEELVKKIIELKKTPALSDELRMLEELHEKGKAVCRIEINNNPGASTSGEVSTNITAAPSVASIQAGASTSATQPSSTTGNQSNTRGIK